MHILQATESVHKDALEEESRPAVSGSFISSITGVLLNSEGQRSLWNVQNLEIGQCIWNRASDTRSRKAWEPAWVTRVDAWVTQVDARQLLQCCARECLCLRMNDRVTRYQEMWEQCRTITWQRPLQRSHFSEGKDIVGVQGRRVSQRDLDWAIPLRLVWLLAAVEFWNSWWAHSSSSWRSSDVCTEFTGHSFSLGKPASQTDGLWHPRWRWQSKQIVSRRCCCLLYFCQQNSKWSEQMKEEKSHSLEPSQNCFFCPWDIQGYHPLGSAGKKAAQPALWL